MVESVLVYACMRVCVHARMCVYACVCVSFKTGSHIIQAILKLAMLIMTLNC